MELLLANQHQVRPAKMAEERLVGNGARRADTSKISWKSHDQRRV